MPAQCTAVCPSLCPSLCCPTLCPSLCPFLCPSLCPSLCPALCPSPCPFLCPALCPSLCCPTLCPSRPLTPVLRHVDINVHMSCSVKRSVCYMVCAGEATGLSQSRRSSGLEIGCLMDTATGLLTFTSNGVETSTFFQVGHPGNTSVSLPSPPFSQTLHRRHSHLPVCMFILNMNFMLQS